MPLLPSRFDPELSVVLERLAARAWPAEEVVGVEGWLLRRTVGVDRRRSNSMLPPADPGHAARTIDLALASAEELGFSTAIQLSPAESHLRLDDALEAQGIPASGFSLVLAGPLSGKGVRSAARLRVELGPLDAAWVGRWAEVSGIGGTQATAELVLSQLGERARFATASDSETGEVLAVAIGVVEDGWLGLFSLETVPAGRRRGVGSAIVDALGRWAATRGARGAYLQVEAGNAGALAFYTARGFHIAHSYHYRGA